MTKFIRRILPVALTWVLLTSCSHMPTVGKPLNEEQAVKLAKQAASRQGIHVGSVEPDRTFSSQDKCYWEVHYYLPGRAAAQNREFTAYVDHRTGETKVIALRGS